MNTQSIICQMRQCMMVLALFLCVLPCTTMQAGDLIRVLQFTIRLVNADDGFLAIIY